MIYPKDEAKLCFRICCLRKISLKSAIIIEEVDALFQLHQNETRWIPKAQILGSDWGQSYHHTTL